jgi:hypothetical protein
MHIYILHIYITLSFFFQILKSLIMQCKKEKIKCEEKVSNNLNVGIGILYAQYLFIFTLQISEVLRMKEEAVSLLERENLELRQV